MVSISAVFGHIKHIILKPSFFISLGLQFIITYLFVFIADFRQEPISDCKPTENDDS